MDAAAELRRNPVRKHRIQPEYGDEQADAGRDCQTRLARPNSQARTGTGKNDIFPFHRSRMLFAMSRDRGKGLLNAMSSANRNEAFDRPTPSKAA